MTAAITVPYFRHLRFRKLAPGACGMLSRLSARWKTSPLKNESPYKLAGVLGTVACTAGPNAAERGVAGICADDGLAPLLTLALPEACKVGVGRDESDGT